MTSVYHYEVHQVLPAGHGQPERRVELRSEYFEKPDTAMKQLNTTLTALRGADGQAFTPRAIQTMEESLARDCMFSEMVYLPDWTIQYLSITRIAAQ